MVGGGKSTRCDAADRRTRGHRITRRCSGPRRRVNFSLLESRRGAGSSIDRPYVMRHKPFITMAIITLGLAGCTTAYHDRMSGWELTKYYPNAAIRKDFGQYMQEHGLPDDGSTFFFENGKGRHRIVITEPDAVGAWIHILSYNAGDQRISVEKIRQREGD